MSEDYWLLRAALAPNGLALMVHAYFDESGTHGGSELMCVAGYILHAEQAIRAQESWDAFLAARGLDSFHMTDCAHGIGAFAGIPKADRSEICRYLIGLIKLRCAVGTMVSVCEQDYIEAGSPNPAIDAYMFCGNRCMQACSAWANKNKYNGPISYFFEAGHKSQAAASHFVAHIMSNEKISTGLRHHSTTFLSGKRSFGIAAADLLAWEWRTGFKNKFGPVRRSARLSLESLMEKTHLPEHWDREKLDEYFGLVRKQIATGNVEMPEKFRRFNTY